MQVVCDCVIEKIKLTKFPVVHLMLRAKVFGGQRFSRIPPCRFANVKSFIFMCCKVSVENKFCLFSLCVDFSGMWLFYREL